MKKVSYIRYCDEKSFRIIAISIQTNWLNAKIFIPGFIKKLLEIGNMLMLPSVISRTTPVIVRV